MPQAWIVDDDDEMSHAVRLMLQLLDHTVVVHREARSAARALLAGGRPDVIVLDINIPQVSGIDFLEFVRMRPELNDLPVLMLSSETTAAQGDGARPLGA